MRKPDDSLTRDYSNVAVLIQRQLSCVDQNADTLPSSLSPSILQLVSVDTMASEDVQGKHSIS